MKRVKASPSFATRNMTNKNLPEATMGTAGSVVPLKLPSLGLSISVPSYTTMRDDMLLRTNDVNVSCGLPPSGPASIKAVRFQLRLGSSPPSYKTPEQPTILVVGAATGYIIGASGADAHAVAAAASCVLEVAKADDDARSGPQSREMLVTAAAQMAV